MITEIGIQAGEIWRCLDENGGNCSFGCLACHTGTSRELLLMALGWLAREGYILVKQEGGDLIVKLRQI